MSATILDGKILAARVKSELKEEVESIKKDGIHPGLAVVIVGNDPASKVYVSSKKKACGEIGIQSFEHVLDEGVLEEELLNLVDQLNKDSKVNGILVQLPLPKHINEDKVLLAIDPKKDVDGFHPCNVGNLMCGKPSFIPCTPYGVMELLKESGVNPEGKECVIVGRSNIVGKPQAMLLLGQNGTVTVCHSKTKNLDEVIKRADILVAAVGRPEMIKGNVIKPGAVVIDVGINRLDDGRLVGDVEFDSCKEQAGFITPVPGGVGPMTIVMLMKNTIVAAKMQAAGEK